MLRFFDSKDKLPFFLFNDYKIPLLIFFHISEHPLIRAPICIIINKKKTSSTYIIILKVVILMSKKKEKTAPLKTMVYKQMLYSMKEPPVNNGVNYLKPKVREASKSDLGSLVNIYNISWMTSNTPFRNLTVKTMENLHNNRDIIILIAKVYGIDAGFIILDFEGAEKQQGSVLALAILPRFQRKGLGKLLSQVTWKYFNERGIKELATEVYFENDASYQFHLSLGFEEMETVTYQYG